MVVQIHSMKTRSRSLAVSLQLGAALLWPFAARAAADSAPPLTDANIAAIVVAANDIDIKAGKLAEQKAEDAGARGLGEMMVRDHQAVNEQAAALVAKLHVTPAENAFSRQLRAAAVKNYLALEKKQGAEFDRAYVANEVGYHQAVISAVQTLLIPAAQNPELKALLENVVPALQAHLEHARHVQSALK